MGVFKEMDPEVARRLVEGYQDELTPHAKAQDAFYRQFRCPRCECALEKRFDGRTAFDSEAIVAKALLACSNCGYMVEPHTNLVVDSGNPAKVPLSVIPIINPKND